MNKEKIIKLIDDNINYYFKIENTMSLKNSLNKFDVFEIGKILGKIEALESLKYEIDNLEIN